MASGSEAGGRVLYSKMMKGIHTQHSWGNRVRMLKLPFILLDRSGGMYAGAIAQFYFLTAHLEDALALQASHPWVEKLLALKMERRGGYEADLRQLLGPDWRGVAESLKTSATKNYCDTLDAASPESLVAAGFILYGALVVGGGKATQAKVRGIFPSCDHVLFDFGNHNKLRRDFRRLFDGLGSAEDVNGCSALDFLPQEASVYMGMNNEVVLSVRCVSNLVRAIMASLLVGSIFTYGYFKPSPPVVV